MSLQATEATAEQFIMQLTNAGILVGMDNCRILIDPFSVAYKGPLKNIFVPFEKTKAYQGWKLIYGEEVFRHVDLMLISHDHMDHYSLPLTVKFLEHHPETTLAARGYLVEAIREATGGELRNAVLVLDEEGREENCTAVNGITIRSWTTQHAGTAAYYRDTSHLTFRLDGSWSLVFLGDMDPSEENFDRIGEAVKPDVAVVPYLYGILRRGERLLDERLAPEMVCYNHIPVPEGEARSWRKAVYSRVARLREKGQNRIILDQFGMMITVRTKRRKGTTGYGR